MIVFSSRARGCSSGAQHYRNIRAVNIRIEQADRRAQILQRDREIHGNGRLAHASLAARDGDEILHPWNWRVRGRGWCWSRWHGFPFEWAF